MIEPQEGLLCNKWSWSILNYVLTDTGDGFDLYRHGLAAQITKFGGSSRPAEAVQLFSTVNRRVVERPLSAGGRNAPIRVGTFPCNFLRLIGRLADDHFGRVA